ILTDEDAAKLLNIAEKFSRNALDDDTRNKFITICGLLWEHRKDEWKALPSFLVQLLIRMGFGPSAKMVDSYFNDSPDQFNSIGSFISELYLTRKLIEYEVIVGKDNTLLLSDFQKRMWEAIDKYNRLGISAPTSAGKSFVLVNKLVEILINNPGEVVYIVPTKSLINQVSNDIRKTFKKYNLDNYKILQTYSLEYERENQNVIYVLTQERALAAFSQDNYPFQNLKLLIIDEVQNIERVANEDDERAHILYDVIHEFNNNVNPQKIIISGPRIKNIDKLVKDLFGNEGKSVSPEKTPPIVNITYTFSEKNSDIYFTQYSSIYDPISIRIENVDGICGFGKQQYKEKDHQFMAKILENLDKSETLIFSPTSNQAVKTAIAVSENIKSIFDSTEVLGLIDYITDSVHPNYSLNYTIPKGIAYHHGKMPDHIRMVIEYAFSKRIIQTLITTTTLMQGMNLPAKNLIARNPNLFIRKGENTVSLTSYEFANLRGRAGRLMEDFVGRVIILDEESFEDSSNYLDKFDEKEVNAGYSDRFEIDKKEIIAALTTGEAVSANKNNNDIIVYIRKMILKYGIESLKRMKQIEIDIDLENFKNINSQLESLQIPKDICMKNPYWDPIILNKLYNYKNWETLPKNPFDKNFVSSFEKNLLKINEIAPYYYEKQFKNSDEKYIKSLLIYSNDWCKEKTLKNILAKSIERDPNNVERIDDIINSITNKISYSIPKLLKPILDIQDQTNLILSFIEMGAYSPITRRLIELGIPRETSIKINSLIFKENSSIVIDQKVNDEILLNSLYKCYDDLNYWEKIQIKDIYKEVI
ncbi:MAG: DEAD/DEAH box helicase, partial [Candidatus Methanoperedens sp.]|nr:DEAD/DEAH box helicase [Candidatus Methanoperedens sp.]